MSNVIFIGDTVTWAGATVVMSKRRFRRQRGRSRYLALAWPWILTPFSGPPAGGRAIVHVIGRRNATEQALAAT